MAWCKGEPSPFGKGGNCFEKFLKAHNPASLFKHYLEARFIAKRQGLFERAIWGYVLPSVGFFLLQVPFLDCRGFFGFKGDYAVYPEFNCFLDYEFHSFFFRQCLKKGYAKDIFPEPRVLEHQKR